MPFKEIAIFLAGFFACDVLAHLYYWSSGIEMKMFGIRFTRKVNAILAVTNTVITAILLWYAFTLA